MFETKSTRRTSCFINSLLPSSSQLSNPPSSQPTQRHPSQPTPSNLPTGSADRFRPRALSSEGTTGSEPEAPRLLRLLEGLEVLFGKVKDLRRVVRREGPDSVLPVLSANGSGDAGGVVALRPSGASGELEEAEVGHGSEKLRERERSREIWRLDENHEVTLWIEATKTVGIPVYPPKF